MLNSLPPRSGISLKPQHYTDIIKTQPDIGWVEIHPENYFCAGGPPHRYLEKICEYYPLSMHGVGLSLGSTNGVTESHLNALQKLVQRYQPAQVSEHIAWSHWNQQYSNDLLPLPYTKESLEILCDNIEKVQTQLGRRILIENPSTYISFPENEFLEEDFINLVCKRSGAGLLLDINNVFVSAWNNNFDPSHYIDTINKNCIGEIHLAGHSITPLNNGKTLRIDDHSSEVKTEVWQLFEYFLSITQVPAPVLIEWDGDIPPLINLVGEAEKAEKKQAKYR